ncbi:hypothetical protein COU57_01525 [Candidatus Pacearchaeota archaeon CG10_big_fil_rev_8_21_14_0_10_32_14]|nr:MAG: hypothetical protein COU57_01525 [Candidatus Pacearchaeota archaeon CG10_big_fil_rev_8_21_14_0_10_32_14]
MAKDSKEKSTLAELKKNYAVLQKKYSLPSFDDLNKDFYIERVSDIETDYILREMRKFISERYSNYMRFVEAILNPVNAPMFVFSIIKLLGKEDKKQLESIYTRFMQIELDLIELDIQTSEVKEADFIKKSYKDWQEFKKSMTTVFDTIKKNKENKAEKNDGNYFG